MGLLEWQSYDLMGIGFLRNGNQYDVIKIFSGALRWPGNRKYSRSIATFTMGTFTGQFLGWATPSENRSSPAGACDQWNCVPGILQHV